MAERDDLLHMILVSNVLILAGQLRQADVAKGTRRMGANDDYVQDAAKLIFEKQIDVTRALARRGN
jgi:hypothetical protein